MRLITCPDCNGTGTQLRPHPDDENTLLDHVCDTCHGDGQIEDEPESDYDPEPEDLELEPEDEDEDEAPWEDNEEGDRP